eukprot:c28108_g1_i4 orf=78-1520(+)
MAMAAASSNASMAYYAYPSSDGAFYYCYGAGDASCVFNPQVFNPDPSSFQIIASEYPPPYGSSAASCCFSAIVPASNPPSQSLQFPGWNPPVAASSTWQQSTMPALEPPMTCVKRPNEEVLLSGDVLIKRPRQDGVASFVVYPQRPGEKDCVFYMKTRTCSFGASCKFDHPSWVPAGGIPDWKEVSSSIDSLPLRPGELDCPFYMKTGICKYSKRCKFNHPKDRPAIAASDKKVSEQSKTVVENAIGNMPTSATTAEGEDKKVAIVKPSLSFNLKGLPIRPGESDCTFYMKTGSCKFGSTCRFSHPDWNPAIALTQMQQTVLPVIGDLSGGIGYPTAYFGLQAIPDIVLSASGSEVPGTIQGLSIAYNPPYPQRPGDQECSYYMKTGSCKFATTCKYHHPLSRLDPSYVDPGVKLTSGLPRHEGQLACIHYMKTGTCRYGPSCKFDHPPPEEAAAKVLAEVTKSEHNIPGDSGHGALTIG